MKAPFKELWLDACILAWIWIPVTAFTQGLQSVSVPDNAQASPAGGSGDSWAPSISRDGRFVLFASTANNLLLNTNGAPISERTPAPLNVFLHDRNTRVTTLISADITGADGGNGDSLPLAVSSNGQYVLFQSAGNNLVAGDTNNSDDVFVRDVLSGTTSLVSRGTNGAPGNGESRSAVMTPDGRYVAFVSAANNLVLQDTNRLADVFVRDLIRGMTVLASVGAVSTNAYSPMGGSENPDITPDGRYVAFFSTAKNLVPGTPAGGDVYIRDLVAGTTILASAAARAAVQAVFGRTNVVSFNHCLGADGQFLAYESSLGTSNAGVILRYSVASGLTDVVYTNAAVQNAPYEDIRSLDMTPDGRFIAFTANTKDPLSETTCVQVWDAQTGTLTLASGDTNGQVTAGSTCDWPAIAADGRSVIFLSSAMGLVTNTFIGDYHLYRRDLQTDSTVLLDADTNGAGSLLGPETIASMSDDARFVAFHCADGNLVPNDRNHSSDVFIRDLISGATEIISAHDRSLPSSTANARSSMTLSSVSGDGRFVAFTSQSDNLVPNDTNHCRDVFVRDLALGTNRLVSIAANESSADGISSEPSITPDGRFIAFTSFADNLVAGDTNQAQDIFLRDLEARTTTLESLNASGTGPGNGNSHSPLVSADARYILFRSQAKNLTPGVLIGENLILRDRRLATNYALTTMGVFLAGMTPDGRFVAFFATNSVSATLYIWDSQASARSYTNLISSARRPSSLAISRDGCRLAYSDSGGLHLVDRITTSNQLVASSTFPYQDLRFSRDGKLLVCSQAPDATTHSQVYLVDLQAGASLLVSHAISSSAPANGPSDSPDISADGRFIAYRSAATDLVSGDQTNAFPNIVLFDRQNGVNWLLSANRSSGGPANNRSLMPVFSADGRTLCFESWASDLTAQDFNYSSDLFALTLFYALILPADNSHQGKVISWPYLPGKNYGVQFKDNLNEPAWQELGGSITNFGNRAWLADPTGSAQRFYRVMAF